MDGESLLDMNESDLKDLGIWTTLTCYSQAQSETQVSYLNPIPQNVLFDVWFGSLIKNHQQCP